MWKQHTLQSNVNCVVKSSAVPKVIQSRNFNCTNLRIFQHTLDLTAQLLTVQLKLKVKLNVCGGPKVGPAVDETFEHRASFIIQTDCVLCAVRNQPEEKFERD